VVCGVVWCGVWCGGVVVWCGGVVWWCGGVVIGTLIVVSQIVLQQIA
jgi:hypothetical protein